MEMFFEDLLVRGAESPVPLINSFMGLLFNCPMKNFMEMFLVFIAVYLFMTNVDFIYYKPIIVIKMINHRPVFSIMTMFVTII